MKNYQYGRTPADHVENRDDIEYPISVLKKETISAVSRAATSREMNTRRS